MKGNALNLQCFRKGTSLMSSVVANPNIDLEIKICEPCQSRAIANSGMSKFAFVTRSNMNITNLSMPSLEFPGPLSFLGIMQMS